MDATMMTLAEAAAKYGFAESTLRQHLWKGRLVGEKRGRYWFVTDAAMHDLIASFGPSRHPRRELPPLEDPATGLPTHPQASAAGDVARDAGLSEREAELLIAAVIWHAREMPVPVDLTDAARGLLDAWRQVREVAGSAGG